MITRIWHGETILAHAEQYLIFLLTEGTEEYRATDGNLSVKVWEKREGEISHFYTVTEWTSLQAVKAFAGEEYEKAKYYPQDVGILLKFEENVKHYNCHDVSAHRVKGYMGQLKQLYSGGSWQGENFESKLKGLTEMDAFLAPKPGIHCVAEILWHCLHWRNVLINDMLNVEQAKEDIKSNNFIALDQLKEIGWEVLMNRFAKSQSQLLSFLEKKTDAFLAEEYQPGFFWESRIEGIIQHDLYHLGQIGLVIRLMK